MGDVKAEPLTLWPTPYNWRRPRQFETLRNLRVEALVETLANPVPDAETKTPLDTQSDMKAEALMDTSRGRGKKSWRHIEDYEGRHTGRQAR